MADVRQQAREHAGDADGQQLAQLFEPAHDLRAHRAARPLQTRRDRRGVEAVQHVQSDHRLIDRRQLRERALDLGERFARHRPLGGILGRFGAQPFGLEAARAPPMHEGRLMAQDARQPRQHRPPLVVVALLQRREERHLHEVVRRRIVADEVHRGAVQVAGREIEEVGDRRRIAGAPEPAVGSIGGRIRGRGNGHHAACLRGAPILLHAARDFLGECAGGAGPHSTLDRIALVASVPRW